MGKSKRRVVIRMYQHMKVWFFNPLCSNELSVQIDRIKMELLNIYLYNIRSQVTSSKLRCFMYLKIIFTLTNISYPDELQHFAALYLGLHCLSKYSLRSQMVKHPCIAIHCNPRREGEQDISVLQDQTWAG